MLAVLLRPVHALTAQCFANGATDRRSMARALSHHPSGRNTKHGGPGCSTWSRGPG